MRTILQTISLFFCLVASLASQSCAPAKQSEGAATAPPFSAAWRLEPKGAGSGPAPRDSTTIDATKPFDFLTVFSLDKPGQDIVVRITTNAGKIGTINTQSSLQYSCTGAPMATSPLEFGGLNWLAENGMTAAATLNWRDSYAAAEANCASRGGGIDSITGAVTVDAALQSPESARLTTVLSVTR